MFDSNLALAATHSGEIEFSIEEKGKNLVTSRMPISKGMLNPFGTIHAGALIWMADVTATVLALQNAKVESDGDSTAPVCAVVPIASRAGSIASVSSSPRRVSPKRRPPSCGRIT